MREVVIIDAVRSPIGRYGGVLASVRPDDLLAHVLKALVERTGIDPCFSEDVYAAVATRGEDNRDVARMSVLLAGFPVGSCGVTVNRNCSSVWKRSIRPRRRYCRRGRVLLAAGWRA
jgi:acetyl-CoA acyltransferase